MTYIIFPNIFLFLIFTLFSSLNAKPNLSECAFIANLFNNNGELVKKICEIRVNLNYNNSENNCLMHGMNLLIFDDPQTLEEFSWQIDGNKVVSKLSKVWGDGEGYWVSGRKNYHEQWFTYSSDKKKRLSSEIPFISGGGRGESCLALRRNESYALKGFECTHAFWHLCEFNVVGN